METVTKDPQGKLDYGFVWATEGTLLNDGSANDTGWLQGDTIASSSWSITEGSGTLSILSSSYDTKSTLLWIQGGLAGERYKLTNHVTTAGGRQDDRTLIVKIREK